MYVHLVGEREGNKQQVTESKRGKGEREREGGKRTVVKGRQKSRQMLSEHSHKCSDFSET